MSEFYPRNFETGLRWSIVIDFRMNALRGNCVEQVLKLENNVSNLAQEHRPVARSRSSFLKTGATLASTHSSGIFPV